MKNKERILIVEDDKINRRILKHLLAEKYDLLEAENGSEAWEIIQENKTTLGAVLTDIIMPVSDFVSSEISDIDNER